MAATRRDQSVIAGEILPCLHRPLERARPLPASPAQNSRAPGGPTMGFVLPAEGARSAFEMPRTSAPPQYRPFASAPKLPCHLVDPEPPCGSISRNRRSPLSASDPSWEASSDLDRCGKLPSASNSLRACRERPPGHDPLPCESHPSSQAAFHPRICWPRPNDTDSSVRQAPVEFEFQKTRRLV